MALFISFLSINKILGGTDFFPVFLFGSYKTISLIGINFFRSIVRAMQADKASSIAQYIHIHPQRKQTAKTINDPEVTLTEAATLTPSATPKKTIFSGNFCFLFGHGSRLVPLQIKFVPIESLLWKMQCL